MANDNIFQQYLKPVKSVMEYRAEYDQADAGKLALQQNALTLAAGQQKFGETQQAGQRAAQLRAVLSGLPQGATDDDRIRAMRSAGTPEGFAAADTLDKSLVDRKKGLAAASKDEADTARTNLTRDVALHDYHAQKLATVKTPEDALAWAQEGQALGVFKQPGQYDRGVANIQKAAQNPQAFAEWRDAAMRGGMSVTEQLKQQLEQVKQLEQVRQFGITDKRIQSEGAATRGNTAAIAAANRAQDDRHFNLREAREGTAPKGQLFQSDTGPVIVDPRTGKAIPVTMNGAAVPPKGAGQKVQDAKSVIALLDLAEPLLDTATDSMLGAGADRVAAAFGQSTVGAQGAAQLRALEGALVAKQPKMSGPQSDKDVLLYRQMAGQIGDATMPVATRRAALKTVRMLNEKYAEQPTAAVAPAKPAGKPSLNDIFGK